MANILDHYDTDRVSGITLNDAALDMAVEAASDMFAATEDDGAALVHGIKGYLFACKLMGAPEIVSISDASTVQIPLTAEQAALMIRLGQMFLANDDKGVDA